LATGQKDFQGKHETIEVQKTKASFCLHVVWLLKWIAIRH